jgi:hypothetical protein
MIEKGLVKKGLHLGVKEIPRKAVGDSDEDAALSHSSGFFQSGQRIIEELEGIDEENKVEFIVLKRKILRSSRFKKRSVSESLFGSPEHERRSIETVKAVEGRVEQGEMISLSASHIQDPLPRLWREKDGNALGHQGFHCPALRRMVPGFIEPGGFGVKDKAHSPNQIRIPKSEIRNNLKAQILQCSKQNLAADRS